MALGAPRTPVRDAYDTHEKYWADSGGDIRIPVDPFIIADRLGVRVYSAILGPNKSGRLAVTPEGQPVIYVNESHTPVRQRFTCAHEIGHYVDAVAQGNLDGEYNRDELAAAGTDPDEIYANRFAAALLMPKNVVEKYIHEGMSRAELARRFNVSQASMDWRLTNLNLTPRW